MFLIRNRFLNQKGQALLIIVLVMVVALTLALSVVSRTIVNLKNTNEQAGSQKALAAAEAGIEKAIKSGVGQELPIQFTDSGATYTTSIATIGGLLQQSFLLNGDKYVDKNDPIYVWITPYSDNPSQIFTSTWTGSLILYWGEDPKGNDCSNAALEVSIITGSKTAPKLERKAFDPCDLRKLSNNLNDPLNKSINTINEHKFYYSATIPIVSGLLVRVNPIYANSFIGVSKTAASPSLPSQGKIITATGKNDDGTIIRKVNVYEGFPEIPAEFFPFTIFQP